MIFDKKNKKKCKNCSSKIENKVSYCPDCGFPQNSEKKQKSYGLLGTDDYSNPNDSLEDQESFGITDKIINSMVNSLMKSLDKQFKSMDKEYNQFEKQMQKDLQNAEIQSFPNGIKIKIGLPNSNQQNPQKNKGTKKKSILEKAPTQEQIKKLSALPKAQAKSSIKRLNNSLNYELATPGVDSIEDIFIAKLEEGYEVKAIGDKKVYTNSLPVNLPLKRLSLLKDKLLVEFQTEE